MNLINKLRMLAEDLYVNGYNRYSAAMSKAADELEQLRAENAALVDDMNLLRVNNTALRAKVTEMEKQEPVVEVQWAAGIPNGILDFISTDGYLPKLGDKLYALPGAKREWK